MFVRPAVLVQAFHRIGLTAVKEARRFANQALSLVALILDAGCSGCLERCSSQFLNLLNHLLFQLPRVFIIARASFIRLLQKAPGSSKGMGGIFRIPASNHTSLSSIELLPNDLLGGPPSNPKADDGKHTSLKQGHSFALIVPQAPIFAIAEIGCPHFLLASLPARVHTGVVCNYMP